jgi:hypothetical protein
MVREYTPIVDGFQIRDVTGIRFESCYAPPENPKKFDIVKWGECAPYTAIDGETGEERQTIKYCYSVGYLEWNPKEPCFEFKSVGLRWLESNPTERVIKMILGFCSMMESILFK